eukprot:6487229-Amphidinium_carterae.1
MRASSEDTTFSGFKSRYTMPRSSMHLSDFHPRPLSSRTQNCKILRCIAKVGTPERIYVPKLQARCQDRIIG